MIRKKNEAHIKPSVGTIRRKRNSTSPQRIQEVLQRQRDFNRTLVQASPAFFVAIGANGKTIMMNKAMLDALGYTEKDVEGTDYLTTFVPEDDREELSKIFGTLTENKRPTVSENHVLTKDGRRRLVEWHGRPILKKNGKLDYFFGVGIDISDRDKTEDTLRSERKRLFSLLEMLPVPICLIAADYSIRFSNRTFRRLYGDSERGPCYRLLHGSSHPCGDCMTFRVFDTGKPEEWEHTRVDGRIHRVYDYPFTDRMARHSFLK